mmetsp:Transcript_9144/g.22240  ORF Transcript_9144/g.22240 Transcript_9144/m.22240 type:complete len:178 (+) Transcript_9144:362-895(+)
MKVSKTLFASVLATLATTSHGCMSPSPTNPAICPSGGSGSCSSSNNNNNNNVFGIPEARRAVLNVRGGELHEPSTLEEVNSLVLRAGSAGQLVVVDFTATWCGPCQMIAPFLKEIAAEQGDQLRIIKMDSDKYPKLSSELKVQGLPTLVLFQGGNEINRIEGAPTKEQLMGWIDSHR